MTTNSPSSTLRPRSTGSTCTERTNALADVAEEARKHGHPWPNLRRRTKQDANEGFYYRHPQIRAFGATGLGSCPDARGGAGVDSYEGRSRGSRKSLLATTMPTMPQ
jgi:hypothetical protein